MQCQFQIEGARRKEHGRFYIGKRCVYVYKAQTRKCVPQHPERKTKLRAIWGKVTRLHGNTGCVRARFNRNLPGHAMGHRIRIVSFMFFYVWTSLEQNSRMMINLLCRHLKPEF